MALDFGFFRGVVLWYFFWSIGTARVAFGNATVVTLKSRFHSIILYMMYIHLGIAESQHIPDKIGSVCHFSL